MSGVSQRTFSYTPNSDPVEGGTLMVPVGLPLFNMYSTARPFGIICLHGHGANSLQFGMGAYAYSPGSHTRALVEAGYVVLSIDMGGGTMFGNDIAMRRFLDAYNYLVSVVGCHPEIGVMGWSMGGLSALNAYVRFSDLIAGMWLWVPLIDLQWARSESGYVPPDGSAVPNNGGWNTEIDAAYNRNTVCPAGAAIPASGSAGVTVKVNNTEGFGDSTFSALNAADSFYVGTNATRAYYLSKDKTHFYGVRSSGAAFNIAAGATLSSLRSWQTTRYSPMNLPAQWRGKGRPVCYALAPDDTTIPPSQADYWLAQVNDPMHFLRPGGKVTGGHTGLFQNIPYQEVVAFFSNLVHAGTPRKWQTRSDQMVTKTVADLPTRYATVAALAAQQRLVRI